MGQARALAAEAAADLSRLRTALDHLVEALPPAELVSHGLGSALRSETATSPVPVDVHDGLSGRRYQADLEDAVFHCCLEAIQNAVKHAAASRITVRLSTVEGGLNVTVDDDGLGFDPDQATAGAGLRNMRDRLAAAGGMLSIRSGHAGTAIVIGVFAAVRA
jgi:signal transduction histidine kinase